jgi:hypothetical protein
LLFCIPNHPIIQWVKEGFKPHMRLSFLLVVDVGQQRSVQEGDILTQCTFYGLLLTSLIIKRVGWVERSDTHQAQFTPLMGFAKGSTHPVLNPPYELSLLQRINCARISHSAGVFQRSSPSLNTSTMRGGFVTNVRAKKNRSNCSEPSGPTKRSVAR